jgi:hypothetical protein
LRSYGEVCFDTTDQSAALRSLRRSLAAVVRCGLSVIPAVPTQIMSLLAALRTCLSAQNTDGVTSCPCLAGLLLRNVWNEPRNLVLDLLQLGGYFLLKLF